jgi:hypothetical protein
VRRMVMELVMTIGVEGILDAMEALP